MDKLAMITEPSLGMNIKQACTVKIHERPYILLTDTVLMESISDMYLLIEKKMPIQKHKIP